MLTIFEAAEKAKVSDKTLRRAIEAGKLVAHQRDTGKKQNNQPIYISEQDLDQWIASRQVQASAQASTNTSGLEVRIIELEATVRSLQSDRLLGAGHDLLALGQMDDVHYSNQFDAQERRITELEATIARLQEQSELDHKLAYGRIDVLEKRINELTVALQDTQDLLVKSSQSQPEQKETDILVMPTYEDEWRITDINGQLAYHDTDEKRIRSRLESLQLHYRTTTWTLHPPVASTPSPQEDKADQGTFELADFSQLLQHEYRSSAVRGDVKAWFTLRPEPQGVKGDYRVDFFESGRADGKRGKLKGDQAERGEQLKTDLRAKARAAAFQAGWGKGPHDIFVCPVDKS